MHGGGEGGEDGAKLRKPDTEWHNYGTILAQYQVLGGPPSWALNTIRSLIQILLRFFPHAVQFSDTSRKLLKLQR